MARENLKKVNGKRMRFAATLERFGTKRDWKGFPEQTLLLRDVVFADDGRPACGHLWFKEGVGYHPTAPVVQPANLPPAA